MAWGGGPQPPLRKYDLPPYMMHPLSELTTVIFDRADRVVDSKILLLTLSELASHTRFTARRCEALAAVWRHEAGGVATRNGDSFWLRSLIFCIALRATVPKPDFYPTLTGALGRCYRRNASGSGGGGLF